MVWDGSRRCLARSVTILRPQRPRAWSSLTRLGLKSARSHLLVATIRRKLKADAQDDDTTTAQATPDLAAEFTAALHRAELAEQKADLLERSLANAEMSLRMLQPGPQRRRRWFRSAD